MPEEVSVRVYELNKFTAILFRVPGEGSQRKI
jgi:hypothetical protein